ncbi:MAG TPA: 16S rRNA (cytidine(1402)-2'-O)-methyltransferase [Crenotrichaceae bacterium]|nr:16S rRNA (cytidine(1402)-2'-O)-methyltransferase [Crenotrichaceae bacterium]
MIKSSTAISSPTEPGLYLVSTPIGNLADISYRAVEILRSVDLIAAEDTRHSQRLLSEYAITTTCISFHDHNETTMTPRLLKELQQGRSIAVISDAGTPLIRDPGYQLVHQAQTMKIKVIPVPGCCAAIAALSASGLATDRFVFAGYPPRTQSARQLFLQQLVDETGTVILYESSHRIRSCLSDIACVYPDSRMLVVAREITKRYESIHRIAVSEIDSLFKDDVYADKGEFVLVLQGKKTDVGDVLDAKTQEILNLLLEECSVKTAVELTAKLSGERKKIIYQTALEIRNN